jgi:flagellar biosynthesis protein FlhB
VSSSSAERSERPTPRRLRDARRRGQIATSRDLTSTVSFAAGALALWLAMPRIGALMRGAIGSAVRLAFETDRFDAVDAAGGLGDALSHVLTAVLPVAVPALAAGSIVAAIQARGAVSVGTLAPKPERLDPAAGLKRLVAARTAVELVKTWLKVAVVLGALVSAVLDRRGELGGWLAVQGEGAFALVLEVAWSAAVRSAALLAVASAADVLVQRRLHERDLRMTKDEVRRDSKEEEGDPHVRSARRQAHREIAMQQMIDAARTATFVAVNPTHLAAAVRYSEGSDDAPRVVAAGKGEVARRIRRAAEDAGVRVVPNRPLARALVRVRVDEEIPESLYAAVAEVLAFLSEISEPDQTLR